MHRLNNQGDAIPTAVWSLVGLRLALIAALALPLVNPTWDQYDDKGMHWRVLVFPFAGLVVPVLWGVAGSRPPYPYLADALVLAVPLTDVVWNTFDAYDRVWWWDDVNHLLNSAVIAYVVGLWVRRYAVGPVVRFCLVLGIGMTLAVGWELAEYPTFLNTSTELATAYRDTLGDLGLALIGSFFTALLVALRPGLERDGVEPEPVFVLADR